MMLNVQKDTHAACLDLRLLSSAVYYNDYAIMCRCECVLLMDVPDWPSQAATNNA